jgi:hypothetical protein
MNKIVPALFCALIVCGCGEPCPDYNRLQVAAFYGTGAPPAPKPRTSVIPFDNPESVGRPYRAIGFMSCEQDAGKEGRVLKAMLYRAADMGADGIILNAHSVAQETIAGGNSQKLNLNVTTGLIGEMIGNGNSDKRAYRCEAIVFTDKSP